jgi:hypothetical protein
MGLHRNFTAPCSGTIHFRRKSPFLYRFQTLVNPIEWLAILVFSCALLNPATVGGRTARAETILEIHVVGPVPPVLRVDTEPIFVQNKTPCETRVIRRLNILI